MYRVVAHIRRPSGVITTIYSEPMNDVEECNLFADDIDSIRSGWHIEQHQPGIGWCLYDENDDGEPLPYSEYC